MALEAFCVASGPSLEPHDLELVRQWRDRRSSERIVGVTNTTFRAVPWADYLFAIDVQWWRIYADEVATFAGRKLCARDISLPAVPDLQPLKKRGLRDYGNSGCDAIAVAILDGAMTIYLLAYDCDFTGGKSHWHGDHPKRIDDRYTLLGNARSLPQWQTKFQRVAKDAKAAGVEIINCSRSTALKMFQRRTLESVTVA